MVLVPSASAASFYQLHMLQLEIYEESQILDYLVGYDYNVNTYVVYSRYVSDIVGKVVGSIIDLQPKACVLVTTNAERAKHISNSPQWLERLAEYNCEW